MNPIKIGTLERRDGDINARWIQNHNKNMENWNAKNYTRRYGQRAGGPSVRHRPPVRENRNAYEGRLDEVPGIFSLMDPMEGAIEAYHWLAGKFDANILSTAPWGNPTAWTDKLNWVKQYLSEPAYKRLILSHHKNLVMGDYLIDDRTARGVDKFQGIHIHFGTDEFKDWKAVRDYLKKEIKI